MLSHTGIPENKDISCFIFVSEPVEAGRPLVSGLTGTPPRQQNVSC